MATKPLTPRQREIMALIDQGVTDARAIGDELGVSRNAVYMQFQKMRHDGNLPPNWTPTGQPPRELRPGGVDVIDGWQARSRDGNERLLIEIQSTIDQLNAIARRLSDFVPR